MGFFSEFISKHVGGNKVETPTPGATPENNVKLDTEGMASRQASKDALTGFVPPSPDAQTNEKLAAKVLDAAAVPSSAPAVETPQQPAPSSTPLGKTK